MRTLPSPQAKAFTSTTSYTPKLTCMPSTSLIFPVSLSRRFPYSLSGLVSGLCLSLIHIYLIHAYAGSRSGVNRILVICELNAEGTEVISDPVMVFDGNDGKNHTVEGPKLYKRNGYYYIFAPAGGVDVYKRQE